MFSKDNYTLDRLEVANNILVRLEMEYKYAVNKNVDKPEMVKFLAQQLGRLTDKAVLGWNEALNNISDTSLKHPPTVPEIVEEMRKLEISVTPPLRLEVDGSPPYSSLWQNGDQETRECFYDTFDARDVSQATRWVSRQYFKEIGWSDDKINKALR